MAALPRGIKILLFSHAVIDLKMTYHKNWKILGFTKLTVFAGLVDRPLPCPLLLNQRAGYYPVGMDGADQFGAMRADEFIQE